jgi:hypothetical protein
MNFMTRATAATAVLALTACGANTVSSVQPTRTIRDNARTVTIFRHGAEIESATAIIVNDGNDHAGFPPGATVKRASRGIEVTFKGVTRTFSSSATLDTGAYHKYAKATQ